MSLVIFGLVRPEPNLSAALARWAVSPLPGVFVADLSRRVADEIWQRITEIADATGTLHACYIRVDNTAPQGYKILTCGEYRRSIVDIDGWQLAALPPRDLEHDRADTQNNE